jgi:ABC-type transport system involved in cytochrome c biogenesis ATPase subunit
MLRSFSVSNFRGFRSLAVERLKRVNIITGRNNVGKTALLEALFLSSGHFNPQLPMIVNAWRGLDRFSPRADDVWGWLFLDKALDKPIELTATESSGEVHRLRITCGPRGAATLEPGSPPVLSTEAWSAPTGSELILDYESSSGRRGTARAVLEQKGMEIQPAENPNGLEAIFLSSQGVPGKEDAERYSRLAAANRQQEVVESLRTIEPRLRGLEVLVFAELPTLHADLGLSRKIPVRLVGAGTTRLLSIILALLSAPRGLAFLDEIENGIHHSVLDSLWRVVDRASRSSGAQVFATTHSWEAIVAAHRVFTNGSGYDLAVYRLDRRGDLIEASAYDQETLDAAIGANLEVR